MGFLPPGDAAQRSVVNKGTATTTKAAPSQIGGLVIGRVGMQAAAQRAGQEVSRSPGPGKPRSGQSEGNEVARSAVSRQGQGCGSPTAKAGSTTN